MEALPTQAVDAMLSSDSEESDVDNSDVDDLADLLSETARESTQFVLGM